jgi:trans-aconitate 2-methyltransferase
MSDPSKDFTPIQDEYDFFLSHSTVADADLDAYVERLRLFGPPAGPIRMLDFGCGPGSFTARFLERVGWRGDRLDLALVEPSSAYRRRAVERLAALTAGPVRAWGELPAESVRGLDLILSNHVLYYVPELEVALGRIFRTLGANGLFLTAIAGRDNAIVDFWFRGFPLIGRPVPYQTAEVVEAALSRLGRPFERREVRYDVGFPDTEENRLKILRFLFGEHLAILPRAEILAAFDRYAVAGRIEMHTGNRQYYVRGGP